MRSLLVALPFLVLAEPVLAEGAQGDLAVTVVRYRPSK